MSNADWWAKQLGTPTPRQVNLPPAPPQVAYQPPSRLPASARQDTGCPGCGSGNYGGTGETRARCYDCGYPITQSGSGVGTVSASNGPATPARQAQGGGFNPTTIVGNI